MEIPYVDPVGCDLVFWTVEEKVYFVEVINGNVSLVKESMLAVLIDRLPDYLVLGFVTPDGKLAVVGKNRLQ